MSAPFVTTFGVRPDALRLAPPVPEGTTDQAWTIRVHGAEVWDAIRVEALPATRVGDVKVAALAVLMPDVIDADSMVVKLAGVEVVHEEQSLADSGARNGSTLLVMSRRRRPVR